MIQKDFNIVDPFGLYPILLQGNFSSVSIKSPTVAMAKIQLCLRTVPTNSEVFLRGLLNVWEKQILTNLCY